MKKNHKLDKIFGPLAFSGIILFLGISFPLFYGIFELFRSVFNPAFNREINFEIEDIVPLLVYLLFLLGTAFIGFTTGYTRIDYENKRIKYGTKLFGIIFIGKWTNLIPDMKLGLKTSTERWGAYTSAGTVGSMSLDYTNLKIVLYDAEETEIIPIKKVKKAINAEAELEKLSELLNLERI
jgi:hypothetical protein